MGALDTKQLIGAKEQLPKFEAFFLDTFFTVQVNSPTEEIAFDRIKKDVVLAPFVSPVVSGKPNRKAGGTHTSLKPAYLKPTDQITAQQTLKRTPGEALSSGSLTIAQRKQLARANALNDQEQSIIYTEEWMASQAIINGSVVVEGEDYPAQNVDFGRNPANNITLAGAARWDTVDPATYDPTDDIEEWAELSTAVVGMIIFDQSAWSKFRKFKAVQDAIKRDSGSKSSIEITPQLAKTVQFKGNFGDYELYVYKGKYKPKPGAPEQKFMPTGQIVLAPLGAEEVRCYGAIQDAKANEEGIVEASRYPSNWFSTNPSIEWLQTQAAPLMVTLDPDQFVSVSTFD